MGKLTRGRVSPGKRTRDCHADLWQTQSEQVWTPGPKCWSTEDQWGLYHSTVKAIETGTGTGPDRHCHPPTARPTDQQPSCQLARLLSKLEENTGRLGRVAFILSAMMGDQALGH